MPSLLPIRQENRGRRREGFKQCLQRPGSTPGPAVPPRRRGAGATGAAGCAGPAGWGCTKPPALLHSSEPCPGPDPAPADPRRPCSLCQGTCVGPLVPARSRRPSRAPAPRPLSGAVSGPLAPPGHWLLPLVPARPAVPGPCPGLLSCVRVVLPRRVLLQRGVPRHPHLRGGPDGQRALRDVPDGSVPRAHQPGPCPVRQQQRHLPVGVPPAAGHVPPGALHRRAPLRELLR